MEGQRDLFLLWIGAAVCAVFLLVQWRKRIRSRKFISGGQFVWAEITGCDNSWLVNGKSYCCFRAKYRDENAVDHEFQSDAVRTGLVQGKIGCCVKVYLTEGSFEDYYIDPDSIGQAE